MTRAEYPLPSPTSFWVSLKGYGGNMLKDLTGQKFGRLTVLGRSDNQPGKQARWLCQCDCGKTAVVQSYDLRSGNTQSCGCQRKERFTHTTHGHSGERVHAIWKGMKSRCYNKNRKNYSEYGGRGIKVCDEWKDDFEAFYNWAMANGYSDDLSIDRIDNDGNYEPSNCRWADAYIQTNNRTVSEFVKCNGETHTIAEWSKISGISYHTLHRRLKIYKWEPEKALSEAP